MVKIGARAVKNRQDVLDWLNDNVGSFISKQDTVKGYDFTGNGWVCSWRRYGAGWFMDVDFSSTTDAALFKLRWGGK